jgi:hypothetical protein
MARKPFILALFGALLTICSPAAAARTVPKTLAPGETGTFRVSDLPANSGFTLELAPAGTLAFTAQVASARGVTNAAGTATVRLKLPETYQACTSGPEPPVCETHPVFPGLILAGHACSDPVAEELPGMIISAVSCVSVPDVEVGGKAPVAPRRAAVMKGIRWSNWGEAVARGRRGSRKVRASHLIDCGGRLHYSRLTVGRRTRKNLAPCGSSAGAQVYPGARVAGASG